MSKTDSWLGASLSLGLLTALLSPVGCAAPEAAAEEQAATASMQKKQPNAVLSARATTTTATTVGVVGWDFFAEGNAVHLVGATATGQAVKTLSTVFRRDKHGAITDVASILSDGVNFPSFHNNGRSDFRALDGISQAFIRRAVLDLGRLQLGLQQIPVTPQLTAALICSGSMIKAIGAPMAGLGSPNLVPELGALDADSDRSCGSQQQPLGVPTIDQFGAAICPPNTPCAAQIAALDAEDRGQGTFTPAFLIAGDGRLLPNAVPTPLGPR